VKDVTQKVENLLNEGREDEAVALLSTQIQLKNKNADLYLLMGRVLNNLGLCRNAQYHFRRSIDLNPGEMAGHANLVMALSRMGDLSGAEKVLEEYLLKVTDQPIMLRLMGQVLAAQARHADAIPYFRKALSQIPADVNGLSGLAESAEEVGDLALSLEALKGLRQASPNAPDLDNRWARINQRITTATDLAQIILGSSNIAATIEQNLSGLTPDVVYILRMNAENQRAAGNEGLAQSYNAVAQILEKMIAVN
jgi:tetratricopeptide (TPR) repeat protein